MLCACTEGPAPISVQDAATDQAPPLDRMGPVDGGVEGGVDVGGEDVCSTPSSSPEPILFALPSGYGAGSFSAVGNLANCGASGAPGFQVIDMNGDGRPDLVVYATCASGSMVVRDHWRVYLNSGSGFAAEATMFPLPGGYSAGSFARPGNLLNCGALNAPGFSLMDVNGDRRPDLVVHAICASGSAVGSDHWRVYLNSGSGFAAEATMFPLPGGYGAGSFAGPGNLANCSVKSTPGYGTADMNGDARPDLVVFLACAPGSTVGTDHWRVYLNTGAGFSADAARFSIPNGYGELTFSGLGGEGACGSGDYPPFSTFDIDGDRRPEIVIPRECMDDAVGTRHWKVFRNICP